MFDFIFGILKFLVKLIANLMLCSRTFCDFVFEALGAFRDWVLDKIGEAFIGLREKYKLRQRNKKEEKENVNK